MLRSPPSREIDSGPGERLPHMCFEWASTFTASTRYSMHATQMCQSDHLQLSTTFSTTFSTTQKPGLKTQLIPIRYKILPSQPASMERDHL